MARFYPDWRMVAIEEGRGFHVDVGAFSTPIVGGGNGTILDADQPEACISVPSGTSIVPIRVHVQCQNPLIAADNNEIEILLAADIASAGGGGTATAETPVCLNTGLSKTSKCTCNSAYTGNATAEPTLGLELARKVKIGDVQGTAANALWGDLELLYEPLGPPKLVGPCALYLYWGGTVATSGFAQIEWLEYTTNV
jgi:hypothetical protein